MNEESHIVSIQLASGQEILGMVWGDLEKLFLTVKDATFIMRQQDKILAQTAKGHDNFMTSSVTVNTSGAFIVELHPDSKLFALWKQANSNILMPQKKPVQIVKGGRLN
uniref:Uncharacterized protein n=1 Tax=viral metagenome TaxID=1070528 RepID=A0A6M3KXE2_9ZZZZ